MRLAIMQPYFLPYIGYFQLIAAVDHFIVYDNIKYTKKGWINRNRMLVNHQEAGFSLPLQKGSDALDIVERRIAPEFRPDKLFKQFEAAYARAPHAAPTLALLQRVLGHEDRNLFGFLHHGLREVCAHLGITTPISVSSHWAIDHGLRGQDKVLALCQAASARTYINAIGGTELYQREAFQARGVDLRFLKSTAQPYPQFGGPFEPWLSIVDVLMFNPLDSVQDAVRHQRELI